MVLMWEVRFGAKVLNSGFFPSGGGYAMISVMVTKHMIKEKAV